MTIGNTDGKTLSASSPAQNRTAQLEAQKKAVASGNTQSNRGVNEFTNKGGSLNIPSIKPPPPPPPTFPGLQSAAGGTVTGTQIDPANSLRQQQLQYNPVTSQMSPGATSYTPTAQPGQVDPGSIDVSGFGIDTGAIGGGTAERASGQRASGGRRLGFQINPQSVLDNAMAAFRSQLPGLNQDFADQSEQLAKSTSAMGRTGSGLFNRDTGFISDRARATREGMLGNLSFQGATADQGADLQAQMTRQNLLGQQENRFANTNVANMQSANQLAGMNAQMANQMSMAGQQNQLQAMLANQAMNAQAAGQNAQMGMQAQLANQAANMGNNQFNAQMGQANDQFNVGNDLQSQMFNIQNQIQQGQFGAGFMQQQQQNQNQLANQAQNDLFNQLGLMGQQGFANNPAVAQGAAAQGYGNLAEMYGSNASQTGAQLGNAAAGGTDLISQLLGQFQGGQPATPVQPPPGGNIIQQPTALPPINPGLVSDLPRPRPDMIAGRSA